MPRNDEPPLPEPYAEQVRRIVLAAFDKRAKALRDEMDARLGAIRRVAVAIARQLEPDKRAAVAAEIRAGATTMFAGRPPSADIRAAAENEMHGMAAIIAASGEVPAIQPAPDLPTPAGNRRKSRGTTGP